jgi:ABC-type transport system involved in cytochrome c biogenesis permease component
MTLLPIVERELRVASRKLSTYLLRVGAAFCAVLVSIWFFAIMRRSQPSEISMSIFVLLTGATGLYSLLAGVRWTADCLSQEKRDGTLGLLFLTDLKGYDVVLGKLVANSLTVFYGLLAVIPVFALPLLLGGVTIGEIGRTALVALNTMFFSLTLGLCMSSLSRSARKSMGATFLVLLVLAGVLPSLGAWGAYLRKLPSLHPLFFWPSPGFAYYWAFDMNYRGGAHLFWNSVGVTHALAWLCLVIAALVAPRNWQDRPVSSARLAFRDWWKTCFYGAPERRALHRRDLLEANPFLWLCARSVFKSYSVWLVLALLACGWVYGYYRLEGDWLNEGVYFISGFILNMLFKGWVASQCGRQLAEERQQGSLELLLCTPLSVRDILSGQWLALRRQFLGPFLFTVVLWFTLMYATVFRESSQSQQDFWFSLWIGGLIMLVGDLYAIYWVGMWQGLTARNPNRVAGQTAIRILVVPWLLIMGFLMLITIGGDHFSEQGFIVLWMVCGAVADFGFGAYAYNKLTSEFREVATQKYAAPVGFWRRFSLTISAPAPPSVAPRDGSPKT